MSRRRLIPLVCALAAIGFDARAAVGVAPEPWLLEQVIEGERMGREDILEDALNRLMLIDADNPEYKLHWLRLSLKKPVRELDRIEAMMSSLCKDTQSEACRQARLIMENDSAERRQALAQIKLLETAGQHDVALEALEGLFGGVPQEESMRLYYYELMLKIASKNRQGVDGLRSMQRANPNALVLDRHVDLMIGDDRIERLSEFGLEYVYTVKHRAQAVRALEEVIRLAPDDRRMTSWQATLLEGRFWLNIDQGDLAVNNGRYARAEKFYRNAMALDPESPYPYLGLADIAAQKGDWTVSIRYTEAALAHTSREKPSEVTRIRNKLHNLRILPTIQKAKALADQGHYAKALKTIDTVKTTDDYHTWLKAEWARRTGDRARAKREYARLYRVESYRHEARIAVAELLVEEKRFGEAKLLLVTVENDRQKMLSVADARTVATLYRQMGEQTKARLLIERYALNRASKPSVDRAMMVQDWAQTLVEEGRKEEALQHYKQAFVDVGLLKKKPENDEVFTEAMLTPDEKEPWEKRSIRTQAADLYQRDNVHVTTGIELSHDAGEPGYSDLESLTAMAEVQMPLWGGTMRLRTDHVRYDVGRLDRSPWASQFGTGFVSGHQADTNTRESGQAFAIAWGNDTWRFDLGRTPHGFEYVDWVGGLEYDFDIGEVGLSTEVYRRAKDSSLLAYGGQIDPNTGLTWGGVRRNGVALNVSYDRGEAHGLWGKIAYETLEGERVLDNTAWQVMGGYYYRLIARPNHEFRLGASAMYWSFEHNLNGYTLGQGGYYSPQEYASFTVQAVDRGRTENWSWEVQARLGLAYAKTEDSARYPLPQWIPMSVNDRSEVDVGQSDTSVSYSLTGMVERRLNEHYVLGLMAGASKSEGYEPRYALIYLRYSWKDWRGDLPMPPQPIEPYSTW